MKPANPRRWADEFDRELFTLMDRASSNDDPRWREIGRRLAAVRSRVLDLLHPDDRRAAVTVQQL